MAYLVRKRQRRTPQLRQLSGLGDLASIIHSVEQATGTALDIASDPYLTESICHIGQLKRIQAGQPAGDCASTPAGLPGGVGLEKAQKPLRMYVYSREHAWVLPAVGAAIFALPFLLGYAVGKDII